ncbi:cobalamin biosynthesis protein CobD/CbiB [Amycolatopsis anabasis]|uniref:cobalamin biosynthesis protein CobD/CbiB n=1 Tax=Amycolatopsis anabasis TaxID=1840409 RepID=UPI00131B7C39|nr:cobalamin biosynthesis protein [Amycolatopsis anabasis]
MSLPRALGIALGVLADWKFGDPERRHPVAAYGRAVRAVEAKLYRDDKRAGVVFLAALVVPLWTAGRRAERWSRRHPLAEVLLTGAATWITLCGTTLRRRAREIAEPLAAGDVEAGRAAYPRLLFTSPEQMADHELAPVVVFAVSESCCDAEVAPLFWGAVAGVPGLLAYRAVNTLDSTVGYLSPRYRNFGWASARLDDVLNYLPSRIAAVLTALSAPAAGGSAAGAWRVWRSDARLDTSPNSGQLFAAFAGALGIRLKKPERGNHPGAPVVAFGSGGPATPAAASAAVRLSARVGVLAGAAAVAAAAFRGNRPRLRRG